MGGSGFLALSHCLNLAAIIVTGVFRFNPMGKLAALSLTPSKYNSDSTLTLDSYMSDSWISDDRTYQDDANVILGLWVAMMAMCLCGCCCSAGAYH